jgi:hypothetical protein
MGIAQGVPGVSLAMAGAAGQPSPAAHVASWLVVIGLIAAACACYRVSLWLHPMRTCRRCGGRGKTSGWFPGSASFCRRCENGLVPRLGTRLLDLRVRSAR